MHGSGRITHFCGLGPGRCWFGFAWLLRQRRQDDRHGLSFHEGRPLDGSHVLQIGDDLLQDFATKIGMGNLSTTEYDRDLHLIPVIQEFGDGAGLELQIVVIDLWPQAHSLELRELLVALGLALLASLLILELAIVKYATHRRYSPWRHFHQVHSRVTCLPQCVVYSHNALLLAFRPDEAHLAGTNALVDAVLFTDELSPPVRFPRHLQRAGILA